MIEFIVDNDVLYKGICYNVLNRILATYCGGGAGSFGILGAARFVVGKMLSKRPPTRGASEAISDFEAALQTLSVVEPSDGELRLASAFEHSAQTLGVELDAGESQLCAILLRRNMNLLLTGDKRAIAAVHALIASGPAEAPALSHKCACLEQAFLAILTEQEVGTLRFAVCSEKEVDRALTACFACSSSGVTEAAVREGLRSYIDYLRQLAPLALAHNNQFLRNTA